MVLRNQNPSTPRSSRATARGPLRELRAWPPVCISAAGAKVLVKRSLSVRSVAPQNVVRRRLVRHFALQAYGMLDPVFVHERRRIVWVAGSPSKLLEQVLEVVDLGPDLEVFLPPLNGLRCKAHIGVEKKLTSGDCSFTFLHSHEKPRVCKAAAECIACPSAGNHSPILRQVHTFQLVRTKLEYGAAVSGFGLQRRAHVTPPCQSLFLDALATELQMRSLSIFPKLSIENQEPFLDGGATVSHASPDQQFDYRAQ